MATTQQAQAPKPPAPSRLALVTRGKVERPWRILVYGVEGVGKSSLIATAQDAVFIGESDGTAQIDVARFPEPATWQELMDDLDELAMANHPYRTVAIDTLDWFEAKCWQHVCTTNKWASIEDAGFGKGYVAALDQWRLFLAKLERLRTARSMNVALIAHCWVKPFKNPEGEDFDRYELKLHAKTGGLIKEWCDAVLFARWETFVDKNDKTKRTRGISTGARVLHKQRTAAYDANNRYDLPETLPLDWAALSDAMKAHRPADPGTLRERINKLLTQTNDETLTSKVTAAVMKAGDDATILARIADKLAADVGINAQENQ